MMVTWSDDDDISTELEYHASGSEDEELDESTSDDDYELGGSNQMQA